MHVAMRQHARKAAAANCLLPLRTACQAALGPDGVLEGISAGKGYVDMSTVDEATSQQIGAAIVARGGRFLEVRWRWVVEVVAAWV